MEHVQTWFGSNKREVRREPYIYIPVSECKAWGEELRQRAARLLEQGKGQDITKASRRLLGELEGEKPDWDGFFLSRKMSLKQVQARLEKEGWRKVRADREHSCE